jgi:hypothetical protein
MIMIKSRFFISSRGGFVSWHMIQSRVGSAQAKPLMSHVDGLSFACLVATQGLGFLLTSLAVNGEDARLGLGNLKKPPRDRLGRTATVDEVEIMVPEAGPRKVRRLACRVGGLGYMV